MSLSGVTELEIEIAGEADVAWVTLRGALRASDAAALRSAMAEVAARRVVVDLRQLDAADEIAGRVVRAAAGRFSHAACLLPGPWCPGAATFRLGLGDLACYGHPDELAADAALRAGPPRADALHL